MRTRLGLRAACIAVLFVLPLALRFAAIDHGTPRNYIPDTHVVRAALGMAKDQDLVPPVGKYSYYPNFLPYVLLPVYAAHYAIGKSRGEWVDARTYGAHVLDHPEEPHLLARCVVALFGALTPWVVFRAARTAGLTRGAWVSAWLVATGLLHLQFSVQERPWVPVAFFLSLSAWGAVAYAREPRARALVGAGLASGLAAACHQAGIAALALPALAWIFAPLPWRGRGIATRLGHASACVAVFAIAALASGHPYLVRYGWTPKSQSVSRELPGLDGGLSVGGQTLVFGARAESFTRLVKALVGYDPVVVLLGLAGLWAALKDRALRAVAVFLVVWSAFFMTSPSDHVRYLLPVTVLLAWPAGLAAERWLAGPRARWALWILLAFPLVQCARFDQLLAREDTRAEAERRLAALSPREAVAIDRYGPLVDLDRESMHRLVRLRNSVGARLTAREERRKLELDRGIDASRPHTSGSDGILAVHVEELFHMDVRARTIAPRAGLESLGADPATVLDSLGLKRLLLVERRPARQDWNPLRALVAAKQPIFVIDPSSGSSPAREAFLPTEMDFPLTGLWSVDRPGPWMALYEL